MFRILSSLVLSTAFLVLLSAQAGASIIGFTSGVELVPPGFGSLVLNEVVSDDSLVAIPELQGVILSDDVSVNIMLPGSYEFASNQNSGAIAGGTEVHSYLVHTDRATVGGISYYGGSIHFENPILGVITSDSFLDLTDGILGLDIAYPTGLRFRGSTEGPNSKDDGISDLITLSSDRQTLTFDIGVGDWMDQVRVLTAVTAVPEPSTALLVGMGLFGLAAARRRGSRTQLR